MINKNQKTYLSIAVIIILVVLLAIFYNPQTGETVKIGAILILSGEGGAWGQAAQRAIEIAVDEANIEGGINGKQIEVIYEDSQGITFKAVLAYEKLTGIDNVVAITGGPSFQTEMSAIAPLAAEDNFPILSPSYCPLSDRPNPKNPLLIWLDPTTEAEQMAEYVYNQDIKSISILGTLDSWEQEVSNAFADKFEEIGGQVYFRELMQPNEPDVRTIVLKATKNGPDAIYIGTYYQFINLVQTLEELGYTGQLYSIEIDEYLAYETKDITSGLEFISSDAYKEEFRQKYESLYGEKSNIPAGQAYDAANILFSFLEQDMTREGILQQMQEFTSYEGVSGIITIAEDNKTLIPTAIFELQEGEIIKIS